MSCVEIFATVCALFLSGTRGTGVNPTVGNSLNGDGCQNENFRVWCDIPCDFKEAKIKLPNGNDYGQCLNINTNVRCTGDAVVRNGRYEVNLTVIYNEYLGQNLNYSLSCQNGTDLQYSFVVNPHVPGYNITYCQNSTHVHITATLTDTDQTRQLHLRAENSSNILVSCHYSQSKPMCTNTTFASVQTGRIDIQMLLSFGEIFNISLDDELTTINVEDATFCSEMGGNTGSPSSSTHAGSGAESCSTIAYMYISILILAAMVMLLIGLI